MKKKQHVLIIEDGTQVMQSLYKAQQKLDSHYDVDLCVSGEDALIKLHETDSYDLLISDLLLLGMSGLALLAIVRQMNPSIRFLLMIPDKLSNIQILVTQLNAEYLVTPYSLEDFIAAIQAQNIHEKPL